MTSRLCKVGIMVQIAVRTNAKSVAAALRGFAKDIPAAREIALKNTAQGIRKRLGGHLQSENINARKTSAAQTVRVRKLKPGTWAVEEISPQSGGWLRVLRDGRGGKTTKHVLAMNQPNRRRKPRARRQHIDRILSQGGGIASRGRDHVVYDAKLVEQYRITPDVSLKRRVDFRRAAQIEVKDNFGRHFYRVLNQRWNRRARRGSTR